MQVDIRSEAFDPWREVADYENALAGAGRFGATAVFVGAMRDFNEGHSVTEMTLEHYPPMVRRHLQSLCERACEQWDLIDGLVIHRVGLVRPGESIVLVAVWAPHRADAYAANRFIMEDLKSRAPFWKKEATAGGERWVEKNTPA